MIISCRDFFQECASAGTRVIPSRNGTVICPGRAAGGRKGVEILRDRRWEGRDAERRRRVGAVFRRTPNRREQNRGNKRRDARFHV